MATEERSSSYQISLIYVNLSAAHNHKKGICSNHTLPKSLNDKLNFTGLSQQKHLLASLELQFSVKVTDPQLPLIYQKTEKYSDERIIDRV